MGWYRVFGDVRRRGLQSRVSRRLVENRGSRDESGLHDWLDDGAYRVRKSGQVTDWGDWGDICAEFAAAPQSGCRAAATDMGTRCFLDNDRGVHQFCEPRGRPAVANLGHADGPDKNGFCRHHDNCFCDDECDNDRALLLFRAI